MLIFVLLKPYNLTFLQCFGIDVIRMEEKQRAEKRQRETLKQEFVPRWFRRTGDIASTPWGDLEIYEYNGKYTEHRAQVESRSDNDDLDQKSIVFNPWQFNNVLESES